MKKYAACAVLAGLLLPAAVRAEPTSDSVSSRSAVVRSVPPRVTVELPERLQPPIAERRLKNGIPVYIVVRPKLPVEELYFVFPEAGGENDPAGKYGLAANTLKCLVRGAGGRDALAFTQAADFLGTRIYPLRRQFDYLALNVSCLSKNLPETLDLAADALMSPAFQQRELEILQKEYADGFLVSRSSPMYMSRHLFMRLLFGEASRYGTNRWGDPAQVDALTVQDIRDYYRQHIRPEKMFIVCCGSVEADDIAEQLNRKLGGWSPEPYAESETAAADKPSSSAKTEPRYIPVDLPEGHIRPAGHFYVVDNPGSSQSVVIAGGVGVVRNDPDYPAVQVMDNILGGPFSSRLNINLREKHGYAYSAGSTAESYMHHGYFYAYSSVQTDKTVPALQEMLREITSMHQPIPEEELRKIIDYMTKRYPERFADDNINDFLIDMNLYGLPKDYRDTYAAELRKITSDDVQRAAGRILDPSKMTVLVFGDAKAIEPQLKEAGWRAQVLMPEDVVGTKMTAKKSLQPLK